MSDPTSSAEPQALIKYADGMKGIDSSLSEAAPRLAFTLQDFLSSCTEYSCGISLSLATVLRVHAGGAGKQDEWVREVAQSFSRADRGGVAGPALGLLYGALRPGRGPAGLVRYGGTDLGWQAILYRIKEGVKSGGVNVAVFEYFKDGIPRYIVKHSIRTQGHAERLAAQELARRGINFKDVARIFSERAPCVVPSNCQRFLAENFPGARVTHSFAYSDQVVRKLSGNLLGEAVDIHAFRRPGQQLAELARTLTGSSQRLQSRAASLGVSVTRNANGRWVITGSRAAKQALGLSPGLTSGSDALLNNNVFKRLALPHLDLLKGQVDDLARTLQPRVTAHAVRTLRGIKGPAVLSTAIDLGLNVYDYGWGANRDKGLASREFAVSATADVSAGIGIVAVSTAIGTAIPIPFVGTAIGFAVGVGLQYAYNKWGREAWHNAVDWTGRRLEDAGRAIADGTKAVVDTAGDVVGSIGDGAKKVASALNPFG